MRILMVGRGVVPLRAGGGGAELVAYQLGKALALDGHEVVLVADVDEDEFPGGGGLTIEPLGSRALRVAQRLQGGFPRWVLQHLIANLAAARVAHRLLSAGERFDVIHTHGNLATTLIARRTRLPVLYTEHDATPWSCRYRHWWERLVRRAIYRSLNVVAYRRAERVVAIFEPLRAELVQRFSLAPAKVATILNGTDIDVFSDERATVAAVRDRIAFSRYCLFVGQLTSRKAPDLLLRAIADVEEMSCVFAGDGPMRRKLEVLARDLGIEQRVVFLGSVPAAELGALYAGADFLILPSVSEGTPLVVLEAMACGIPVLATRVAGLPFLVQDWETGFVVKPGDVGQLAMGMRFLHGDDALRGRMGATARGRARQSFPWPLVARRYAAIYEQVSLESAVEAFEPIELQDAVPILQA